MALSVYVCILLGCLGLGLGYFYDPVSHLLSFCIPILCLYLDMLAHHLLPVASTLQHWLSCHRCQRAHILQSAVVPPRALLILTGAISSLNCLWKIHCKCGWPDEFLVTLNTFLWLIHEKQCILRPIRMIIVQNKIPRDLASHTLLNLFAKGTNISTSCLTKFFFKDSSQDGLGQLAFSPHLGISEWCGA